LFTNSNEMYWYIVTVSFILAKILMLKGSTGL